MRRNRKLSNQYTIDFETLCQLPYCMHVYWTDTQHRILGSNPLHYQVLSKFSQTNLNNPKELQGYSLFDIFAEYTDQVKVFVAENEMVLSSGQLVTAINTLYIPNKFTIELITTKFPFYDRFQRLTGVLGLSYYQREIDHVQAEFWRLSSREIDCLDQLMMGKTAKEISQALNISKRTVEFYLENIKNKLSCNTKNELILKANEIKVIKRYSPPTSIHPKLITP